MEEDLKEYYLIGKIKRKMNEGKRCIKLVTIEDVDESEIPYDINDYYKYVLSVVDENYNIIGEDILNSYYYDDVHEAIQFSKKHNLKNCIQRKSIGKYLLAYWDTLK